MKPLLLLSALLLVACGSTDERADAPAELPAAVPLPECPDEAYALCDIRTAKCQTALAKLAACLRGNPAPPEVPIEVLTESAYVELVRQDYADVPESPVKHFSNAISVFGLSPPNGVPREDDIAAQVANLGGVYRSKEKRIVIVDHGTPANDERAALTLVHELVHALQDAEHDLAHWPDDEPTTFDSELALRTVIEGEASFYQYRAAVPFLGLDIAEVDFEMAMQEHLDARLAHSFDGPLLLSGSFATVPYGMGALVAFQAWQNGGTSGLDPVWASPPRSMKQVMSQVFGQSPSDEAGIDIPEPEVTDLELYDDEELGAWGLNLVLGQPTQNHDNITQALTWRGDHLWVYIDPNANTVALWQLELDSPEAAQKLDRFFEQRLSYGTHDTAGSRVFVAYSVDNRGSELALAEWGQAWLAEP